METKTEPVFTKVSREILFTIKQAARIQGLTVSEYVRFVILTDLERRGMIDTKPAGIVH